MAASGRVTERIRAELSAATDLEKALETITRNANDALSRGRYREAIGLLSQKITVIKKKFGTQYHPDVATAHEQIAQIVTQLGLTDLKDLNHTEAARLIRSVLANNAAAVAAPSGDGSEESDGGTAARAQEIRAAIGESEATLTVLENSSEMTEADLHDIGASLCEQSVGNKNDLQLWKRLRLILPLAQMYVDLKKDTEFYRYEVPLLCRLHSWYPLEGKDAQAKAAKDKIPFLMTHNPRLSDKETGEYYMVTLPLEEAKERIEAKGLNTYEVLTRLGEEKLNSGDYQGAHDCFVEALSKSDLKTANLARAVSLSNIGMSFALSGEVVRSIAWFVQAHAMFRELVPRGGHPDYARVLERLGNVDYARENYESSLAWHTRALEMRREIYDGDHLEIANSLNCVGGAQLTLRLRPAAKNSFLEALAMFHRVLGDGDDPRRGGVIANLKTLDQNFVCFANEFGTIPDRIACFKHSIEILTALYPSKLHEDIGDRLNDLGIVYFGNGQNDDAEEVLLAALETRKGVHGEGKDPKVADSHTNLAILYMTLGRQDESKRHCELAMARLKREIQVWLSLPLYWSEFPKLLFLGS